MFRRSARVVAAAAGLLITSGSARAEEPPAPAFKLSGLAFGDYYYVAQSHRDALEGRNGFWLRRVYFTYDHTLSKAFSLRLRFEANSKGDFVSSGVVTPYLKDAYLKWSFGAQSLAFGLAPTPAIDFVDTFQGYRSLEKSPVDLYRWDGSRDLGLLAQGQLGGGRRTSYAFQFGNGSGTGSETDASKSVRGQLAHRFAPGLVLEAYADWQDRPEGRDVSTLEALAGWQRPKWRASLEYGRQRRRGAGPAGEDLALDFLSAFAVVQVSGRVALVGRVDRSFDPVPNGETTDYLPLAETARPLLGYVAADVAVVKTVHLMPNVEAVAYDHASGDTPRTDVVPRLTLFFTW